MFIRKLLALLLIVCGLGCTSVMAQTCGAQVDPCPTPTFNPNAYQVGTSGNAGNLTWNLSQGLDGTYTKIPIPGSTFNPLMQDFSGVIQVDLSGYYTSDAEAMAAGGGWVATAMSWTLYGTNGGYSCGRACSGRDRTIVSQATIVPAAPLFDSSGGAVMGPGYSADSALTTIQQWGVVPGTAVLADGTPAQFSASGNSQTMTGTNVLKSGKYLVSFTATGCTGSGCGITTFRYFFSTVRFTSHYVAPPATCGTPTTPPCDD